MLNDMISRRFFSVVLLFIIFESALAQYHHFEGTIGTQKFIADLYINPNHEIRGYGFFISDSLPLHFSGKQELGTWKLKSFNDFKDEVAQWEVKKQEKQLSGKYITKNQSLPINLSETYDGKLQFIPVETEEKYEPSKDYGLKMYVKIYLPLPELNKSISQATCKTFCDSILADIGLKNHSTLNSASIQKEFSTYFLEKKEAYQGFLAGNKESCDNAPFTCQWETQTEGYPTYNMNGIVVYRNAYYEYSGGAHGMSGSWHLNYDLNQNKLLALQDLFKPNTNKQLLILIKNKIKRVYQTNNLQSVDFDAIFIPDNFQVTYGGIIFHYNTYDIGPYALGSPEIFIPFRDLRPLLNPNHPFKWLK